MVQNNANGLNRQLKNIDARNTDNIRFGLKKSTIYHLCRNKNLKKNCQKKLFRSKIETNFARNDLRFNT